jgi:hypothetical protein
MGDPNYPLRRLIVVLLVSLAVALAVAVHEGVITNEPPADPTTPDILEDSP